MPSQLPMTPCPTDDTLGAMVQHALGGDEAERVASHLDGCAACRQIVLAAVRGGAAVAPPMAIGTPSLPVLVRKPAQLAIGTRIGRYELRALLGAGGMGQVYDAYDAELDRAIALKVLRPELTGAASVLAERLVRESRIMARVTHPSVITVYDVGRDGDAVFIAMELVRGETLAAYIARTKPAWREVVAIFERAGQGLAAAHSTGVVHRDFKPDNVLVELEGGRAKRVVVTDFGIAHTTALVDDLATKPEHLEPRSDVRLTATGMAIGTPAYMAPEQLGGRVVDLRADVFAFSVSLWEALFGERPFAGKDLAEIRAAMKEPPRPPHGGIPGRLLRALERGLARDAADRWPDMRAMLRELAAVGSHRRAIGVAAAAAGLVGIGIAAALAVARPAAEDRCAAGLASLSSAYGASHTETLRKVLGGDPQTRDAVLAKLDATRAAWKQTHLATCKADREPIQPAMTTACLDARRLELAGYVEDVVADGAGHARVLGGILGEPGRCATPAPGLLASRVPADPVLRRKVTAVRYRAFDLEAARDRAEFKLAIDDSAKLVGEAAALWPPLHAEVLYLLGTSLSLGGDNQRAFKTLREAAAVAESAHHDYIAANVWTQLVMSAAFDEGDPTRALEYATYGEAAVERLGNPPAVTTGLLYVKGTALVEAGRNKEAEGVLRQAVELAETSAPEYLPQTIQGLGYLYEDQGRYVDAVEAYRRAIRHLPETGAGAASSAIIFRTRLALNLSLLGKGDDAEVEARRAVELADKTLGEDNIDRPVAHLNLAQVLSDHGRLDEALVEVRAGARAIAKIQGERNERYGEALMLEAVILSDLQRFAEAAPRFARACEIIAFQAGDGSSQEAECWMNESDALSGLGRDADALALMEKVMPVLVKTFGEQHPQVANAFSHRGANHAELGHHAAAVADLETAIALFEASQLEPGHLAGAMWMLAQTLWTKEPERARELLAASLEKFKTASAAWSSTRAEAAEWLATNGKPKKLRR